MDVSSFLGGNWLTQMDIGQTAQVWTIREVKQELVGSDTKVVVYFHQHAKGLGLNKVNLRVIAGAYGVEAAAWINRQLELYRDTTFFQGKQTPCIRVRVPTAAPPAQQQPPAVAPPAAQPAAPVQAPVAADNPPWAGQ